LGLFAFIPFFTNGNRRFLVLGEAQEGVKRDFERFSLPAGSCLEV
jgi:hypothetical protein